VKAAATALSMLLLLGRPGWPAAVLVRQPPPGATSSTRGADRIKALQREAEVLAGQERTLLGDLRKLEVERDLRTEEARKLDAEIETVARQVDEATSRIAALDGAIQAARPGLDARLVDVYKLGRPGYARALLGVGDLREVGRAARMISALARIDQRRVQEFTASIAGLAATKTAFDQHAAQLKVLQADARTAADLATRAAAAREDLVHQIDARRDLNAQMAGELEVATQKLQKTLQAVPGTSASAETVVLPIKPFRGALEWPLAGRVLSRFGGHRNPAFGTSTIQNGVEIESVDGQPVRSVHDGRVTFADVFAGLGQLVIVDHGGLAFSLYGYLGSINVTKGTTVSHGQVIGTAGRAPAGNSAVYFELRIDGAPVDPLQWLKGR
jgi:septal ring factor EnvC (AmiA/AmiB activator)